ncbi:hypothetical protein D3C71_1784730 [compost metagenome]
MIHALRDVIPATTSIAAIAAEYQPTCFLKFSLKSRVSNFLSFGDKNDPITETSLFDVDAHTDFQSHNQEHVVMRDGF